MYPRKPKELADDLESFVYVPLYCLFRYHKHDLSSSLADTLKNAKRKEQAADNYNNLDIASAKHAFFYTEARHSNGLYSGGRVKYTQIRSGEPPIQLWDSNSPAAKLLRELFLLLKRHYKTIKFDDLRQYLADPTSPPKNLSQPIDDSDQAEHCELPRTLYDLIGMDDPGPSGRRGILSSSSSSAGSLSVRPLDDHTLIAELFNTAWNDKHGRVQNITPYRADKLYDQFDGNMVIRTDEITDPTNSSSDTEKSKGGAKKRKSDASEPDPNPRPKRKAKRAPVKKTVAHGIQIELRSTLSDDGNGDGDGNGGRRCCTSIVSVRSSHF